MLATSSWVWGWNSLVAVGTIGLACVTGWLAWTTRSAVRKSAEAIELQGAAIKLQDREVKAVEAQTSALTDQAEQTRRQVNISVASLEAASRPVLVGVVAAPGWRTAQDAVHGMIPISFVDDHVAQVFPDYVYYHSTDERIYCSVPLRNVGAGVAFIQRVELVTSRSSDFPLTGKVMDPIVPRDEMTRTLFAADRKRGDGRASEWEEIVGIPGRGFAQFTIRVVYTGASHELVTVTEITSSQLPGGGIIYTAQEVWNGEGEKRQLLVSAENIST